MSRLWVGNLDVEAQWARRPLPTKLRRRLSELAALLAYAADPNDSVWTEFALEPNALNQEVALAHRVTGTVDTKTFDSAICWGASNDWTHLAHLGDEGSSLVSALAKPLSSPEVATRVNARSYGALLERQLFASSLGNVVNDEDSLRRALAAVGGRWVAKPEYSAAGRGLIWCDGDADTQAIEKVRSQIEDGFVIEPWLERTADYGCTGIVLGGDVMHLEVHRLLVNARGRFQGIEFSTTDEPAQRAMRDAAGHVAVRLYQDGYRGPFGIDGFEYTHNGVPRMRPLCEVNARMTFGIVARLIRQRFASGDDCRLCVGFGAEAPKGALSLLAPTKKNGANAWLERF